MKANLFKTIALSVLALLFLAPSQSKAQVADPYKIANNTRCKIDIKYEFYEKNPNTGACDIFCTSGTLHVPPGTSLPIAHGCTACGVIITIYAVNGIAPSPLIVAGFNMPPIPPNAIGADPAGCSSTGVIRLNVTPGFAQITP